MQNLRRGGRESIKLRGRLGRLHSRGLWIGVFSKILITFYLTNIPYYYQHVISIQIDIEVRGSSTYFSKSSNPGVCFTLMAIPVRPGHTFAQESLVEEASNLSLTTGLGGKWCCSSHFTDEEAETQRG